jgi:hypothetical protein
MEHLNIQTSNEMLTPLHFAAKFSSSEVIKCLITEYGADKEKKDKFNRTPLYIAAEFCMIFYHLFQI